MEEQKKIEIPEVVYQGDDKKLKERVSRFKAGSLRIAIFTVVGFAMGACSHLYVRVSFFPVKLVLAVPYKISEAVYVSVIGTDAAPMMANYARGGYWFFTEFFPHSLIATFMAECCTTVLIGGAIYGSLAYFTGDRRVFTLQRFLKFAAVWCGIILMIVGATYLVNYKAVCDNEALRGTPGFFIHNSEGKGRLIGAGAAEQTVRELFYSELEERYTVRDYGKELTLEISFGSFRRCCCRVNYERQYLVTEGGRTYHISEEFAQIIRRYEEEGLVLPEHEGGEGVEVIGEVGDEETDGKTGEVTR